MKLKNLFWAIVAGAAALVSCEKEVDLGPAKISASPAEVTFTKEAGSQEITLNSSRDWKVNSGIPEWIALSKETGVADTKDQKVTISVTSNSGHDRSATLVFNIGYGKANVVVKQAGPEGEIDLGDGTLEKPFTVAGVLAYTRALPADQASDKNVYFKGKISTVATTFEASGTYGNATFYIVDEDGGESFYVFQTYYLGNRKWKSGDTDVKEGDNVIVCGKVVNYKGNTPETVSKGGSFIYSLNGKSEGGEPGGEGEPKGDGTLENPYNPAGITAVAAALADNAQSEQSYYMKGKISNVKTTFAASGTYGNATFYIVDETDGTGEFYIYQTYYLEGKKWVSGQPDVAVGDIVTVYGPVTKYVSSYGTTLETVGKGASYIYSHEKGQGGDEPGGDTGEIKAVSVAEFLAASVSSSQWYELTGTVSNIKSDVYGNFDLSDASGTVYIYGLTATKVEKNDKSFASLNIKEGDTVTLITLRAEYQGTAQGGGTPPAYIKGGGGDEPGGDTGEYENAEAKTVAEFIAAADKSTYFKLTGTVSNFNATYCSFDLTDASGSIYVYSVDNKAEWTSKISNGGTVTLAGKYDYYAKKEQHEVINAVILSFEASGDNPGGGDETEYTYEAVTGTTIQVNNEAAWAAATDATYGKGFEAVSGNIKVGMFKYESNTDTKAPDQYSARVYVGSVFVVSTVDGSDLTAIEFTASDPYNGTDYAQPLKVLVGGNGTLPANTETKKIGTWKGSASKVVFQATPKQVRLVSMTYAPGDGGGDEPGGDEPSGEFETDLSKIYALADDADAKFEGLVTALTSNSCVVSDGTNNLYVFKPATVPAIGDKVQVEGKKTTYNGIGEIAQGATVTVVSSNNPVTYPNAKVITTGFDSYTATVAEYIEFTGKLAKSGNYYNVTVAGASTNIGSISNPVDALGLAALDGKDVTFTGYYVGKSGGKYINLACVKAVEAAGGDEPGGDEPGGGDNPGGDEPGGDGTSYVLDKDAITSAHSAAWSYTSGSQSVTATDGSVWTLYNTYASKNQVTVQMNKGKGAYVLTPTLPAGMEVKTIAVVLNSKNDGTGNMGDRPMDILNADGTSTLLAEKTGQTLADGIAVPAGNQQVRIICNEAKGGAVYITSITVTYGAAN